MDAGCGVTALTDAMRAAAGTVDDPHAALLTAGSWHLDRMLTRLSRALGESEAVVALSEGLDLRGSQGDPDGTRGRQIAQEPAQARRLRQVPHTGTSTTTREDAP